MKFTKYQTHGAYHWKQYEQGTKYKKHADFIKEWVEEEDTLDVGAGDGFLTHHLGIRGIDNEQEAVRLAQNKGANVILGDAYSLNFCDDFCDSILMADVLEHLERPAEALQEARRVLKKFLYITTPPRRPDGKLTDKFHYQEWTPDELKILVEQQGFTLQSKVIVLEKEKTMYAKFKKV